MSGVGLWVENGQFRVVLPHPYGQISPESPDFYARSLRLLAVLRRYQSEARSAVDGVEQDLVQEQGVEAGSELDKLEAALLLLRDWHEHGEVVFTESRLGEKKPGRIAWEKTLRRFPPAQDPGGLVFPRLMVKRVEPRWDHPVQLLQRFAIREIQKAIQGRSVIQPVHLPDVPDRLLASWGSRCFTDRQRWTLGLLSRYFRGQRSTQGNQALAGIFANRFEHVWERMLKVGLDGRSKSHSEAYSLKNGQTQAGMCLKPDFFFSHQTAGILADAKYYPAGRLPPTDDLTKQSLYWLLKVGCEGWDHASLVNAFLFPNHQTELIARFQLNLANAGLPACRILCVGVSVDRVMDAYLAGFTDAGLVRAVYETTLS